ncbi:hypothetical protein MLD38_016212 [Melastoma candidum]|uniref:Uncharacterized protein n=2 Tax=Melastoma candidum TaxID=119954 RepID=A0ACB9RIF8_9MYRT|nr:hypothetical protein MLD38_016211 [Melastoma candidum]KAI4378781.1 hypothetical protein MLD38_016212 [Melastoma candidum]
MTPGANELNNRCVGIFRHGFGSVEEEGLLVHRRSLNPSMQDPRALRCGWLQDLSPWEIRGNRDCCGLDVAGDEDLRSWCGVASVEDAHVCPRSAEDLSPLLVVVASICCGFAGEVGTDQLWTLGTPGEWLTLSNPCVFADGRGSDLGRLNGASMSLAWTYLAGGWRGCGREGAGTCPSGPMSLKVSVTFRPRSWDLRSGC